MRVCSTYAGMYTHTHANILNYNILAQPTGSAAPAVKSSNDDGDWRKTASETVQEAAPERPGKCTHALTMHFPGKKINVSFSFLGLQYISTLRRDHCLRKFLFPRFIYFQQ